MAIKNKVLDTGQLPHLIARLPALLEALSSTIKTDIPPSQQIALANLARKLSAANIRQLVIDEDMTDGTMISGASVLMPNMALIGPAVANFFNPSEVPTPAPVDTFREELRRDNATVAVLNGTTQPDLAQQAAEWLSGQGYNVVGFANADRSDYAQTQLLDYGGKTLTLRHLSETFAIADENLRPGTAAGSQADILLILGADLRLPGS